MLRRRRAGALRVESGTPVRPRCRCGPPLRPDTVPDAINFALDAPHHPPVFMLAMPNAASPVTRNRACPAAAAIAIATITTTGTIGTGVRARVQ